MKIISLFLIIYFLLISNSFAFDSIYETEFININIVNENISEAKIKEIDRIKYLSLENILKNILTVNDFKLFSRSVTLTDKIDYLVKNIIIEEEFISLNRYSAKVKINFENLEIIKLLRSLKIDYTDYISSDILVISSKSNQLSNEGLSSNNIFYKNNTKKKIGLINLIYPDLSNNDRFILPYKKIIDGDLRAFKEISNKYNSKFAFIINITQNKSINIFDIKVYSLLDNQIKNLNIFESKDKISYENLIHFYFDKWWKNSNYIDNSNINVILCLIKSFNLEDLNYINESISSVSQIKSNTLTKIKFGENLNNILFYGDISNLSNKLKKYNILLNIDNKKSCTINIENQ